MRVYLSGPITGRPNHRAEFAKAAESVTAQGCIPVDPHDIPPACQTWDLPPCDGRHSWECNMRGDIAVLVGCDGVVLLPDWEKSRGALAEQFIARMFGIPVKEL